MAKKHQIKKKNSSNKLVKNLLRVNNTIVAISILNKLKALNKYRNKN